MLRVIFFLLLAVNAVLFGLGRGYFGNFHADVREPARLRNQLNANRITLLPAAPGGAPAGAEAAMAAVPTPAATVAPPAAVAPPKPAPKAPELFACTEVGNFVLADARRFEALIAPLELGDRQSRYNVPGQEITSYIVYIPPLGNKEAADKKASELKQLGVDSYFIMSDNTPMRWAISLGVFKLEAGAQNLLAALVKQGVHSAKVGPRYGSSKQLAFQFRALDRATRNRLDQIKAGFPTQEMRACK